MQKQANVFVPVDGRESYAMYNVRKANMGRTVNRYATALMEAAAIQSQANVYVLLDSSERVVKNHVLEANTVIIAQKIVHVLDLILSALL